LLGWLAWKGNNGTVCEEQCLGSRSAAAGGECDEREGRVQAAAMNVYHSLGAASHEELQISSASDDRTPIVSFDTNPDFGLAFFDQPPSPQPPSPPAAVSSTFDLKLVSSTTPPAPLATATPTTLHKQAGTAFDPFESDKEVSRVIY
jgi:hypothetical protein